MRKFVLTVVLLFSFITLSYAQPSISIGTIAAPSVGEKITVPITVTNFSNVGGISLKIDYNSSAVRFDSTNRSDFLSGANSTTISITRADYNPVSPENGTLINIYLTYLGGNTDLTFTSECEISTITGVVIPDIIFNSGEITEPCDMKIELGAVNGTTVGGQVSVPVNVTAFNGVGAITLTIQYDPAVLEFVSVSRSSEFFAGASNPGVVAIARADFNAVTPADGKLIDINFTYLGGSTDLTFDSGNEIANTSGVVFECVNYTGGSVTEVLNNPPHFTATMANTTIAEGQTLTFNYDVADPDTADDLSFSVVSPEDATIEANSGLFSWTPGFDAAGTHNVIVSISDGTVSVSDTAVVTVTNVNRAPFFTDSLESITDGETGQEITFDYNATDPDDDNLTFALVTGPAGASINTQTGVLTYTLGEIDTVQIVVSVSDGSATSLTTATVAIVTSITNTGGLPTEYALSQNYPNPFNPTTKIKFSLPAESHVTLNVYNLLGEQVASLINTFLPASHYEFNFDASALTSGIYIYKLQAGEFITSKKMTLVK